MRSPRASTDRAAALAQGAPLAISIDEYTALVDDPIEEERRPLLHLPEVGDVHLAPGNVLKATGEVDAGSAPIGRQRNQQIEIRSGVLIASRERAVEHSEADAPLGTQGATKLGDEVPMGSQVLPLSRRKTQPPRTGPPGMQCAVCYSTAQRPLLRPQLKCQLLNRSHWCIIALVCPLHA